MRKYGERVKTRKRRWQQRNWCKQNNYQFHHLVCSQQLTTRQLNSFCGTRHHDRVQVLPSTLGDRALHHGFPRVFQLVRSTRESECRHCGNGKPDCHQWWPRRDDQHQRHWSMSSRPGTGTSWRTTHLGPASTGYSARCVLLRTDRYRGNNRQQACRRIGSRAAEL